MTQIRGSAIRGTLKFIKSTGLPGGVAGVIEGLPAAESAIFDHPILTSTWYPYEAFAELLRQIDLVHGAGSSELMAALGRFAARQDVTGVFKLVSVLATVPQILQSASLFWGRYCDTGRFEIVELVDGHGIGRIVEFPTMFAEHARMMSGWIEGMGVAAGATAVSVELTSGIDSGDDWWEYDMKWSD